MVPNTKKFKTPPYIAAAACFLWGLLAHLFGLVNVFHNADDIHVQPYGFGTGVASGRWLLTILGDLANALDLNYNLPFFNGLVFLALLALSAGLLVSIFHIRRSGTAALMGMILVTFPTVCSTLTFKFTAGFYGLAFLFAVGAVWVLPKHRLWGLPAAAVLIALSLGIYQAYLGVTTALFVLRLCQQTLEEDTGFMKLLGRGLWACLSIVLGLVLYFAATGLFLDLYDKTLNTYLGIDHMGKIPLTDLPGLIFDAYQGFFQLPISDYNSLAPNSLLRLGYLLVYILSGILIAVLLVLKKKKPGNVAMVLILCTLFPVAVNLIEIMCPDGRIYTMMVFGCVVPLFVPLVLAEQLPRLRQTGILRAVAAVLLVIMLGNVYFANVTYTALYYATQQTENYMVAMVTQVRMAEGFDASKKWAFIGNNQDTTLDNAWHDVPAYGGARDRYRMHLAYSWQDWIELYLGYDIPTAYSSAIEAVKQTEEFHQMPCWPAAGSIRVIDELVVIKFQES